jgi:hypothetical protein
MNPSRFLLFCCIVISLTFFAGCAISKKTGCPVTNWDNDRKKFKH